MSRMLFKCGVRNAERGTASFRLASLTRKFFNAKCKMQNAECYLSAERGVRNAERPRFALLHSQGNFF